MTDSDRSGTVQPVEPPDGGERICRECGAAIPEGASFCARCGTELPAPPLSFESLPDWWKKAAVALGGLTVLGVLLSLVWPSGEPDVPDQPDVEESVAEPETPDRAVPRPPYRSARARKEKSEQGEESSLGRWSVRTEVSPLDDIKTVYLDLKAVDSPQARGTSAYAPQLSLMCTGAEIEGYVFIRSPPEVERSGFVTARIRFDALDPKTLQMERSLKEDALFFDKPVAILKQMFESERLLFGYTPRGADEVVTEFDLRGVEEAIKPFQEACTIPEISEEAGDRTPGEPAAKP